MNPSPLNKAGALPASLNPRPHRFNKFIPGADKTVRDYGSLDPVLGRIGSLEVRLATTTREIRKAQRRGCL